MAQQGSMAGPRLGEGSQGSGERAAGATRWPSRWSPASALLSQLRSCQKGGAPNQRDSLWQEGAGGLFRLARGAPGSFGNPTPAPWLLSPGSRGCREGQPRGGRVQVGRATLSSSEPATHLAHTPPGFSPPARIL